MEPLDGEVLSLSLIHIFAGSPLGFTVPFSVAVLLATLLTDVVTTEGVADVVKFKTVP